jgi:predicted nuclease of predicted toxin-antitoxin system
VRLLFDENLSRKPVERMADLYPGSVHVTSVGLAETADLEVWRYAKTNGYTIVSTDADYFELAATLGPPPQVIWLRRWTHPTRDAENLLRREAIRIAEFGANPELGILALEKV